MKKLTLFTAILITANMLFAQIIHIPADYPTIQEGILAASDGDTVLVHTGTYYENVEIWAKSITLASLYLTTQDTSYMSQTVIDGGQQGSVLQFFSNDINISGFTIQNGYADGWVWPENGGGIFILGPSNFILSNLIISSNSAENGGGIFIYGPSNGILSNLTISDNFGGGVYLYGESQDSTSNIYIKDVIIRNNQLWFGEGGGIHCKNFDPVLEDVVIEGNTMFTGTGIGGYFYQSSPILRNVRVMSNTGPFKSLKFPVAQDALFFDHASPLLQNVLIVNHYGYGINLKNSEAVIHNSTLSYNSDFAIDCYSSSATLINSIFWGNNSWNQSGQVRLRNNSTCSVSYCDIQDGLAGVYQIGQNSFHWLEGNISDNPLFENTGDSTCQLSSVSPCIDTGTPDTTGLNLPLMDLLGNHRIWDGNGDGIARIDMGAYEFDAPIFVGIPQSEIENRKSEIQVFPNPFNTHITIEFNLPQATIVSIQIFNAMGAKVSELHYGQLPAGQQRFTWHAGDLPKGLYFCRVRMGNESTTQKLIKY